MNAKAGRPTKLEQVKREGVVVPFRVKVPRPPAAMNATAKKEWKRITKELVTAGLIYEVSMADLVGYCEAWARARKAAGELEKGGEVLDGVNGGKYISPWLGVYNTSMKIVDKVSAKYGFNPTNVASVQASPVEEEKAGEGKGKARFFKTVG